MKKKYAIEQTLGFKVLLNPDAYDGFIKRNVTNQTVYDYVTTQTKDFGVKNNFIKSSDEIYWTTNSHDWLSKPMMSRGSHNGCAIQNFRLIVNGNAFILSLNDMYWATFYVGRSDTDVWPTI